MASNTIIKFKVNMRLLLCLVVSIQRTTSQRFGIFKNIVLGPLLWQFKFIF